MWDPDTILNGSTQLAGTSRLVLLLVSLFLRCVAGVHKL
jgi:hypothetical protein